MKIGVKADGLAVNHIPFRVENHESQEPVWSAAKELEGSGARTRVGFPVSTVNWNLSLML